jgi:hypothetical protein
VQVKNKPREGGWEHAFILGSMVCTVANNSHWSRGERIPIILGRGGGPIYPWINVVKNCIRELGLIIDISKVAKWPGGDGTVSDISICRF